ncbi:MAG: glycoside hydrolase, partial [Nocardioides sp.]|nr:glycoside hydrolase [Nocardioides sp.]
MAGLDALALRVLAPGFAGTSLPTDYAQLLREGLGGICLFGSNVGPGLRALTDSIRSAAAQAPVIAVDEEGGDVTRLEASSGSSVLGAAALGAAGDLALTTATGARVGAMLADAGIGLDLAPVADVNSNPANPVIGTRSFAPSPGTAAEQVTAWCRGLQSAGVAACVKHFPGHGDTDQDSHLTLPVLDVPLETLRSRELVPFAAAFEEGAAAVMTAHILVPSLDPDLPASLSPAAYGLLDELGYAGLRVTDALDMAGVSAGRGIPAAAVLAL